MDTNFDNETLLKHLNSSAEGSISSLSVICHGISKNAGWWNDIETGEKLERNVPEMLCLIHSEISEAMEGYRKNLKDDKLPEHDMFTVELADAMIRILDLAGGLNLDLGTAFVDKINYNTQRSDHKIENRKLDQGKKF